MRPIFRVILSLSCLIFSCCATKKYKDIAYLSGRSALPQQPKLNVFSKRDKKEDKPVLIFIHGGNWNTGNKDTYGFFGRNFAKRGIVTVIPDYTLSPNADFSVMAAQISETVKWVKANIAKYGGNPNRVFITGHSAGGHLAALAAMDPRYGLQPQDISGIILNDAAGLDMKHYLEQYPPTNEHDYLSTWTADPDKWREASPIFYIGKQTPPIMVYIGDQTYESIKTANDRFLMALKPFQPDVVPIRLNKSHIPMVLQYFWPWSGRFDEVIHFMETAKK